MAEVLVTGVAVVDFVFAVDNLPDRPAKYRALGAEIVGGGCGASAAVAVSRLGGTARLAARMGDDVLGDLIVADLERDGVDCTLVQRTKGARSSFSSVYVDAAGERQIMNFRGEGLTVSTDWITAATRADVVLVDTRWADGAIRALDLARAWGVPGVVDAEAPMDITLLERASHVAFSRDGLFAFSGGTDLRDALRHADQALPGWVCVTDGAAGVYYLEDGHIAQLAAPKVDVRDTLGAGDIWHGAFALGLAEGQGEGAAMRFANAAAALKCTTLGGRKGCPDRFAVEEFQKETK